VDEAAAARAGAERRAARIISVAADSLIIVDAPDLATIGFILAALGAIRAIAGTLATNVIAVAAKVVAKIMTLNLMMKILQRSLMPIPSTSSRKKHNKQNTCKPTNEHLVYVLAASCHFGISF
jgi:hypothetical protein